MLNKLNNKISFFFILILIGCSGNQSQQTRPSPVENIKNDLQVLSNSNQKKLEFFPTANRIRENVASFIIIINDRQNKIFNFLDNNIIEDQEQNDLNIISNQEKDKFSDLIFDLENFTTYLPVDSKSYSSIKNGTENLKTKYSTFNLSISGSISDQNIDDIEKTSIESNNRALTEELKILESLLPLPPDSLETGSAFIFETDSVDLFFEVVKNVDEINSEMEKLRMTIKEYESSKNEMNSFLEREKKLNEELNLNKSKIDQLNAKIDTSRNLQNLQKDSLSSIIRITDTNLKNQLSNLSLSITDSITKQSSQTDSLFFSLGTNMAVFQNQVDSLKSVVRYYDIAEKGLPEIDEDVLNILKLPKLKNKITLKNGTIVVGHKIAENLDIIVLETTVGKLVIEKDYILEYDEQFFPGPKVEFLGKYKKIEYPDREEFFGKVKNIGKKRADFVKITFFLWSSTTDALGVGDAMVDGSTTRFDTGVISDASLNPGQTGNYHVIVPKQINSNIEYRTNEVSWRDYKGK